MTTAPTTEQQIQEAAKLLRAGKLVAFPTETVYGLGADATNEAAVKAIFKAKGRPASNPLIVHVASFEDLLACTDISKSTDSAQLRARLQALTSFWPGPLSVVVPKASHITPAVSAGGPSVALRIPRHPIALRLLEISKLPIAAPSANPSMYISPTTAQHVRESLGDAVATVLDGGPCDVGIESTVLSLMDETPTVLRPGAVTIEDLSRCLKCQVKTAEHKAHKNSAALLSPGLLAKHYSPHTPVVLLDDLTVEAAHEKRVGVVLFSKKRPLQFTPTELRVISEIGDLNEVASGIFSSLRELDKAGLDYIAIDTCEPIGLGAAIMDRIIRASSKDS